MSLEPIVTEEAPLLSNGLEHRVDTQAESLATSHITAAALSSEEHASTEDKLENAPTPLSCDATFGGDAARSDAVPALQHMVDAGAEIVGQNAKSAATAVSHCAEENAATEDQQDNAPASLIRDAALHADTARTAATDELDNLDGAESHVKIDAQNPHAEIAALDDVVACVVAGAEDTRNEVTSSRDVSEQLSFGNLFEECSDRKKSTTSSDLSELTPSDDLRSSSDLHLFEGEHRTREKTQLSNDILLDIFAWLQRFELDIMHIISRKFRDAADASVPQFSYRYINVVEYRNGRMEFSVNVFFRGEIAGQ
ncbi:hypothetical protein AAVH_42659 [Aphelenchoides avenae]|nr:hypothetical protein AAVH_42659 [Aphelenchus avenae]